MKKKLLIRVRAGFIGSFFKIIKKETLKDLFIHFYTIYLTYNSGKFYPNINNLKFTINYNAKIINFVNNSSDIIKFINYLIISPKKKMFFWFDKKFSRWNKIIKSH